MSLKHTLLLIIVFAFAINGCGKLSKCKKYVGDYTDRGQLLSIKYENEKFSLEEAGQSLPCTCNENGYLEIKGNMVTLTILLSDSAGRKRFCFSQDSLQEDCIYAMQK